MQHPACSWCPHLCLAKFQSFSTCGPGRGLWLFYLYKGPLATELGRGREDYYLCGLRTCTPTWNTEPILLPEMSLAPAQDSWVSGVRELVTSRLSEQEGLQASVTCNPLEQAEETGSCTLSNKNLGHCEKHCVREPKAWEKWPLEGQYPTKQISMTFY